MSNYSQKDPHQYNNPNVGAEQESEINLADLLMAVRTNWYWFALSIIVCVLVAVLYIKSTPKTYQRNASVLIRDDRQSGGGGFGESAIFSDLNLFGGGRNVDNELLVFQSRSLAEKVVRRLSLDKSYKINEGLRKLELYTKSPVDVNFETAADGQIGRASCRERV